MHIELYRCNNHMPLPPSVCISRIHTIVALLFKDVCYVYIMNTPLMPSGVNTCPWHPRTFWRTQRWDIHTQTPAARMSTLRRWSLEDDIRCLVTLPTHLCCLERKRGPRHGQAFILSPFPFSVGELVVATALSRPETLYGRTVSVCLE